jgi:hypothetical protein
MPPVFYPQISLDGTSRLLMLGRVPARPSAPIEVIVNWQGRGGKGTSP